MKALEDNRNVIQLKYDESLRSPGEFSVESNQNGNTIEL